MDTIDVGQYLNVFDAVYSFLDAQGGSAPLYRVFTQIVKPSVPSGTISIFKLVVELKGLKHGFKISSGAEVILVKPPTSTSAYITQNIPCVCTPPNAQYPVAYNRVVDWADHVFDRFDFSHEEYEMKLIKISQNREIRMFHCLACNRPFLDLVRLVKHCRAMEDPEHTMFGKIVIGTLLGPNDNIGQDQLFLTALETGDSEFPWKNFSGLAKDVFEDIPFHEPSTPIDLSDDSDVVEVMELQDSDESDMSTHDMQGVINLEE
jgi:hypothetical protein